jgi:hypothetical protein
MQCQSSIKITFNYVFSLWIWLLTACILPLTILKDMKWVMGLKKLISAIWLLQWMLFGNAQEITKPLAGPGGLNGYSMNQVDLFSTTKNRAALAQIKNRSIGLYGERRFLLEGLNNYLVEGAIAAGSGCFGIELGYFGFSRYNQTRAGLAYALKLGSRMDAGVQFNYHLISIPGYGFASAIGFEIAALFHLTEKLHAGIQASNPAAGRFGKTGKEKLATVYRGGLGYDPSIAFFAGIEIVKEELMPVYVNAGIHYAGVPGIIIKAGLSSAGSSWWAGIIYLWGKMSVGFSIGFHPQLGITPAFLLLYKANPAIK